MNRIVLVSTLFIIFCFTSSCSVFQQLANVNKPTLKFDDVSVTDLSLDDLELTFDLEIKNPNSVAIKLNSLGYDLSINEINFINGNQDRSLEVAANNSSIISIPVRMSYQNLFNTFTNLRNNDESTYHFKADVGFDLPILGATSIPLEYNGTFPIVKRPSFNIGKLSVEKLSLSGADLKLDIDISNPNTFGIDVIDFGYNLNLNGLSSVTGIIDQKVNIGKKSTSTISIPLNLNFLSAGMAAYNIIQGNDGISYSLDADVTVGTDLPIFKDSSFNFDRSGTVNIQR